MIPKEQAYETIAQLVERFGQQLRSYKKADYNETLVRRDFIDPFFKALGWDVDNSRAYAETLGLTDEEIAIVEGIGC